ncbi:MAG: hypothetical protein R3F59_14185 [Myxococcota bacterium]
MPSTPGPASASRRAARPSLEAYYRGAFAAIREASAEARGLVELHSYGDLGSTYDKQAGGRPVRRPAAAIVHGGPWATPFPVGLARLVPGDLRGLPWAVEVRVEAALGEAGFPPGPSPYPTLLPWTVSSRFLAARWFAWLGRTGRLPGPTAQRLAALAWTDEQHPVLDAALAGELEAERELPGLRALGDEIGAWSHQGAELGDRFLAESGCVSFGVEMRYDLRQRAGAFGEAVARAVA